VISRRILAAAAVCAAVLLPLPASAQQLTQQQRMKSCNAQASERQLKGDERQQFMSSCLTGKEPRELTAQQQKMASCNRTATERELKGNERKAFMKECLSARHDPLTEQQARMRDCNEQAKGLKGEDRRRLMSGCLKGGSAAVGASR
jgi:hypothetical protein